MRPMPLAHLACLGRRVGAGCVLTLGICVGMVCPSIVCAQQPQAAQPSAQAELLAEVARRLNDDAVVRGEFEQTKAIKGFKKPLVSRGRFVMAKGRGVQWITVSPFPSTLVMTRERITTHTEGGVQQIDTRQEPGLRAVNELLMAVLAGDMRALASRFQVEASLQGTQAWRMTLQPKDSALKRFVARIEMDGDRHVQNVQVSETSGDGSHIRFTGQGGGELSQAEADRFKP